MRVPLDRVTMAIIAVCALGSSAWGCSASGRSDAEPAPSPRPVSAPPDHCDYDVSFALPGELDVAVACDGPVEGFVASEASMAHHVALTVDGSRLVADGGRFRMPAGATKVHYRIPLHVVAQESRDIDVAYEAHDTRGSAFVTAVSTWVLQPYPVGPETRASIRVSLPRGMRFTTGMARQGDHYELLAREIRFATYGVFGHYESEWIELPGPQALDTAAVTRGANIELVTLPGALAVGAEERGEWVKDTAEAISVFWRGFPVEHALVLLVPTPRHHGIAHGKVVAAGGASVAIHIGSLARKSDLYADWILVHELFHLGFPSFSGEGKWLDEGLATYFEPIIRARAGWRTPETVWHEFASDMGDGLVAVEATGVEKATSFKGIYWGGAILALVADVKTRERTGGKLGLEDGLRAVLAAGGNASQLWKLDRAIQVIDERLGSNTLRRLADTHSFAGQPIALTKLLHDLGVDPTGDELVLNDDAALSGVRRAIIAPP